MNKSEILAYDIQRLRFALRECIMNIGERYPGMILDAQVGDNGACVVLVQNVDDPRIKEVYQRIVAKKGEIQFDTEPGQDIVFREATAAEYRGSPIIHTQVSKRLTDILAGLSYHPVITQIVLQRKRIILVLKEEEYKGLKREQTILNTVAGRLSLEFGINFSFKLRKARSRHHVQAWIDAHGVKTKP